MRTREEHMNWCKRRALEELSTGDWRNAMASMVSDIRKHPETSMDTGLIGGLMLTCKDVSSTREFIEGFN